MTNSHLQAIRGVRTDDEGTMAYETARTRWPVTVQKMIDDCEQTANETDKGIAEQEEMRQLSIRLMELKQSIEKDGKLSRMHTSNGEDLQDYNDALQISAMSWCSAPWLFAECYLYRTVQNVFAASEHWRDYDVFQRQKDWTFIQSRVAVEELAKRFSTVISIEVAGAKAQHLLFEEMTQIALWGNATDLSLLTKLSLEDIQSLQGSDAIARNRRNIVSDDTEAIWKYLNSNAPGQVDLVLDNSGFEFFADLIYACYLLQKGLASKVQLHTKTFPWFVSDVTPRDVTATLDQLSSTVHFPNREGIDSLTHTVQEHLQSGCLVVDSHPFWTTSLPFTALPQYAPDLFEELRSASVVIFKGDLNYRKLVNDGLWPFTTPFKDALGSLGRESGVRIVALRTNKADVCVGISDEQKVKQLEREAPNSDWTKNGKYAVISFSDGV